MGSVGVFFCSRYVPRYLDPIPIDQIGRVDFVSPKSGAPLSDAQRKIVFDINDLIYLSLDRDPV